MATEVTVEIPNWFTVGFERHRLIKPLLRRAWLCCQTAKKDNRLVVKTGFGNREVVWP